jgi:hypothetical protein
LSPSLPHRFQPQRPSEYFSSDGRFEVVVDAGRSQFVVVAPGMLRSIHHVAVLDGETLDLGDISMTIGDRICGAITRQDGQPVAGAQVIWGDAAQGTPSTYIEALLLRLYQSTTRGDGVYKFDGVDTHRSALRQNLLRAIHPELGASLIRDLPSGDVTADLVLFDTGEIRGTITDYLGGSAMAYASRAEEPHGCRRAPVDSRGHFVFRHVPVGKYQISVEAESARFTSRLPTLVDVATNTFWDLFFDVVYEGVDVNVVVRGATDAALVCRRVGGVVDEFGASYRPTSIMLFENDVYFGFERVLPGAYDLEVNGAVRATIHVTTAQFPQALRLSCD